MYAHKLTRIVHNVCGNLLRCDICRYGNLFSSQGNLNSRKKFTGVWNTDNFTANLYPKISTKTEMWDHTLEQNIANIKAPPYVRSDYFTCKRSVY